MEYWSSYLSRLPFLCKISVNSSYGVGLLGGLNKLLHVNHLEQYLLFGLGKGGWCINLFCFLSLKLLALFKPFTAYHKKTSADKYMTSMKRKIKLGTKGKSRVFLQC